MANERKRVPDWLLERLAAGELPEAEAAELRRRLEAAGETGRLHALEASNREVLAAHPPAGVAAEVQRRLRASGAALANGASGSARRSPFRLTMPVLAMGAVAGLAVLVAGRFDPAGRGAGNELRPAGDQEQITLRGLRPTLAIYRKSDSPPRALASGSRVRPGDVVQVKYVAGGKRYGVVASVDARGEVTLHLPERPGAAPRLRERGATAVPSAFELDETPGFERFVFVTADAPFSTGPVIETLRTPKAALPAGLDFTEVVLQKEAVRP